MIYEILAMILGLLVGLLIAGSIVTFFQIRNAPEAYENEEAFFIRTRSIGGATMRDPETLLDVEAKSVKAPKLVRRRTRRKPVSSVEVFQTEIAFDHVVSGNAEAPLVH